MVYISQATPEADDAVGDAVFVGERPISGATAKLFEASAQDAVYNQFLTWAIPSGLVRVGSTATCGDDLVFPDCELVAIAQSLSPDR